MDYFIIGSPGKTADYFQIIQVVEVLRNQLFTFPPTNAINVWRIVQDLNSIHCCKSSSDNNGCFWCRLLQPLRHTLHKEVRSS